MTIKSDWSWRSVSLVQMFPSLISITLTWVSSISRSDDMIILTLPSSSLSRHDGLSTKVAEMKHSKFYDAITVAMIYLIPWPTSKCRKSRVPLSKQFQATISSPFTNPSRFEKANGTGSWFDLFRTKGNRHRTWVVVTCSIFAQATGTTLGKHIS